MVEKSITGIIRSNCSNSVKNPKSVKYYRDGSDFESFSDYFV